MNPDETYQVVKELKRLLRTLSERPGGQACSEHMEGVAYARYKLRKEIRERIKHLTTVK